MLGGFALAALLLNTAAAIVVFFVYKWVLPGLFALGAALMGWFEHAPALDRLPVLAGRHLGLVDLGGGLGAARRLRHRLARAPARVRRTPGAPRRGEVGRTSLGGMTAREDAPREDGRADDELRPVTITRNWLDHAAGSVLIEFGRTKVLCAASASPGVPRWRKGSGLGWVTAEYAMLPASTNTRSDRESVKGRIGGRTHEISRLIGRSLRAVIDYQALGENTIQLDCDVLQADGGTRTAAITGAYVALADAVAHLRSTGALTGEPLTGSVAAISVGIIDGDPAPRPAVRRGRPRRDRHERRDDRRGQVRRGAGHRRGRGLRPRRARRAAGAGQQGLRRPRPASSRRRWRR